MQYFTCKDAQKHRNESSVKSENRFGCQMFSQDGEQTIIQRIRLDMFLCVIASLN